MRRKIKKMVLGLSILTGIIGVGGLGFMAFSPQFGGSPNGSAQRIEKSPNFKNGKFRNLGNVKMDMSFGKFKSMWKAFRNQQPNTTPENPLQIDKIDIESMHQYDGPTRLFWIGHSSFILQTHAKIILIDPVFGHNPSPIAFMGPKRFNTNLPVEIKDLPQIDAIIISHDHYDHLDLYSIKNLKDKTRRFIVPLGVKGHLVKWGVEENRIEELDWWQETVFEGLELACTPAQHFSGRGKWFADRESTLWCSWVIKTETENIFFSGDSGYGAHFKTIGEKYGPFDFAMIECGQYNKLWEEIHMMPEQSVQAGVDIQARLVMPIHWSAFKLAMHVWTDPVNRFTIKAKALNQPYIVPKIGQSIQPAGKNNQIVWWEN